MAIVSVLLLWVTYDYTTSTKDQVRLTRESLIATREAMRLDQRPWLGYYNYAIQARENPNAVWETREPRFGEEFRIEFFVENVGKTPALEIELMSIVSGLIPIGIEDSPKEPDRWSGNSSRSALFPNTDNFSYTSNALFWTDQQFLEYSTSKKDLFFWARLYYCDFLGRRYWTQTGVVHEFDSNRYYIKSSSVGLVSGEAPHPDCQ